MTRRLAITILLTVWAAIFVAELTAYITTRTLLLAQLDESVKLRLASQLAGTPNQTGAPIHSDDTIATMNPSGRLVREQLAKIDTSKLQEISKSWLSNPDGRLRIVNFALPNAPPVYGQASAENFDDAMSKLGIALLACGITAGVVAALAAAGLAKISLRPLSRTAEVIGTIDESNLDRRIDADALPIELRPMAGRCNEMLERLGRAFEERRRFLADASHELRTPVAALITTMEVALRRPRPAVELAETMQTCLSEARHMRLLVQALLRQVRAEGTANEEEAQNMDAGEMLNQCADLAGSLAAERDVHVVRSVRGKVPVRAEPGRLRSVVLNLMSNAIEYNHPGGTVELSARSTNDSTEIVVKDDGPGISPEHLPHLFQPFYRGNRSREADGHLGLGLFLVDSHVKAMGGECCVESEIGAGTTFRVRLPATAHIASTNGGV